MTFGMVMERERLRERLVGNADQRRAQPTGPPRPPWLIKDEMGQLDVTIYELGQLDLDNRTEYSTNFDIMKMAILAYFPVRENRMHFSEARHRV